MSVVQEFSVTGIKATKDIRITIPAALGITWDTSTTAATIGGPASTKITPTGTTTVTFEDSNRTVVIDVISDFVDGDSITVSGLKLSGFTSLVSGGYFQLVIDAAGTIAAVDAYFKEVSAASGGSGDGSQFSRYSGMALITTYSTSNQNFLPSAASTAMNTLAIYQEAGLGSGITAANGIRIRIPAGLDMVWDTSGPSATFGGSAAGRVSSQSWADAGKTLVVNLGSSFADGETLTVSVAQFTAFNSLGSGNLAIDITGSGSIASADIYFKDIGGYSGGGGDGAIHKLYSRGDPDIFMGTMF